MSCDVFTLGKLKACTVLPNSRAWKRVEVFMIVDQK